MFRKNCPLEPVIPFDGELLNRYERKGLQITGEWAVDIQNLLTYFSYNGSPVELPGGCLRYDVDVVNNSALFSCGHIQFHSDRGMFHIYEMPASTDPACRHGILLEPASSGSNRMELRDFYALLMLNSIAHLPKPTFLGVSTEDSAVAARVAVLFEREMLLDTSNKTGWNQTGMRTFIDKATFWTRRCLPIRMALPAFPCKTTNRNKAATSVPDGGEFEALANLSIFCNHVQEVYEPGCFLYIVSDGHVFSDCIGADDSTVTLYSRRLKDMLKEVHRHYPIKRGGVEFLDLETLLVLDAETENAALGLDPETKLCGNPAIPHVNHPVTTQVDPRNDFCRRVLITFFSPPSTFVRDLLMEQPHHSLTALYRGFSRFMFEDLAFHPDFQDQTNSKRKKAAEEVAREMILRNQAYSRLVERVLPMHIRLSIHAHDSAGPKFAVQLLRCRSIADNSPDLLKAVMDSQAPQDTLHIPTPWHNTIAEVYFGHDEDKGGPEVVVVVCKASAIIAAVGKCIGGYDRNHPRGGRFLLWLDQKTWAKSKHLFDDGVAGPEMAVRKEDFRFEQRYEFVRPGSQQSDSGTR